MPILPVYDPQNKGTSAVLESLRRGMPIERLSSGCRPVKRTLSLVGDDLRGLKYTPSKKSNGCVILFTDVREISKERGFTKTYRKAKLDPNECVIVNVCGIKDVKWQLVFKSKEKCEAWLSAIGFIIQSRNDDYSSNFLEKQINSMWDRTDLNHDDQISREEVKTLLLKLSAGSNEMQLKEVFAKFDASGDSLLDKEEFTRLYMSLFDRSELKELYLKYAKSEPKSGLTLEEFIKFSRTQGCTVEEARQRFLGVPIKSENYMPFTHFVAHLFDVSGNSVVHPKYADMLDDMNQPLAHYFINSSHNTYLTGNQINSSSSVDMYKNSLLSGCRCVELDCTDGPNDDPIIYHKHTLTSKIRFEDVIKTVDTYGFIASPYPVILSLEVHLPCRQSAVMAKNLENILGSKLLTSEELKKVKYTPEGMKGRVLVKWKMNGSAPRCTEEDDSGGSAENGCSYAELSSCVAVGVFKTKDFGKDANFYNVQSYTEDNVRSLIKASKSSFVEQNLRMLSRVYPKGIRMGSSNYNPMDGWTAGCQIVALNQQTWDAHMRVNSGMFLQNNGCGYVLKPSFLRNPKGSAKPVSYELKVKVIGGFLLPRPAMKSTGDILDPFVELRIVGEKEEKLASTKSISNNGLNPVWNETFTLLGTCFELDILSIRVLDANAVDCDREACEFCLPIKLLRNGYRAVPMRLCKDGMLLDSATILCHYALSVQK